MTQANILFVDDEPGYRKAFIRGLADEDIAIETAVDGEDAMEKLVTFHADLVITDVKMPRKDGLKLLEEIKLNYPDVFVVVVTAYGDVEDAVRAMKAGAYDFLLKPFDFDIIKMIIGRVADHKKYAQKDYSGIERRKRFRFKNIIGQDQKMFNIFRMISDVAKTNTTVLITGESGTGKELVAEAIHYEGLRRERQLIKVNCSALTESLINSELFGHEKGAFTDARSQKKGHFELAHDGTIFLDEIGDISISTQLSLLRVLEMGTFHRVGGTRSLKVDARVICATNKDLPAAVKQKLFREDLYYRINVVSIHLPPLRERKTDIPLLAHHFLEKYRKSLFPNKKISRISRRAMSLLLNYDWPGNVRELANVIENGVIFCRKDNITPKDLPINLRDWSGKLKPLTLTLASKSLPQAESALILHALEGTNWNLKKAAQELEIARGTLYSKMQKYNIVRPVS